MMAINHRIDEALERVGYSPSATFRGNVEDLKQCLDEIRELGIAENVARNVNWQDLIYAVAIEIDNIRDMQEWKKDRKPIHSLPYIAEAFIPKIGERYDHYLVSFAHNRDGLCDMRLGHRNATFETVMGIRETDTSSFLLFRDRFGLLMPQTRELCYHFNGGEFTGHIEYLFLGRTADYPEDKSKPISEHLFPYMFSRYIRSFLSDEFKKYFTSCIPNSQKPLVQADWKEEEIEAWAKDIGAQVHKTYSPEVMWKRMQATPNKSHDGD